MAMHKILDEIMLIRMEIGIHSQQPGNDEDEQKHDSLPVLYARFICEIASIPEDAELPTEMAERYHRLETCCANETSKLWLEVGNIKARTQKDAGEQSLDEQLIMRAGNHENKQCLLR